MAYTDVIQLLLIFISLVGYLNHREQRTSLSSTYLCEGWGGARGGIILSEEDTFTWSSRGNQRIGRLPGNKVSLG